MISFNEKKQLMEMLPEFFLFTGFEDAVGIQGNGVIEAATVEEVLAASEMGLGRREIFFTAHTTEEAAAVLGKCRIVADSWEDLVAINEAAKPAAAEGQLTMVGLRLEAVGHTYNGQAWTTSLLRKKVHDIKQLKAISVCGCIVVADLTGLHGKTLGKYVRASYQTAKDMTYILPCTMPYICVGGLLEQMAKNQADHPETLTEFTTAANIVGMQNTTAFYADYYIQ